MVKDLIYEETARNKILMGAEKLYRAVSSTLGPRANNVAIERSYGSPIVIHDGVNVARECVPLRDKYENIGAELLKDAADKMDAVGDGTTLTTILTYELAREANRNIVAGANPMMIRHGMQDAVREIAKSVEEMAIALDEDEQIKQVAVISAQDEEIGELISGAIKKLGKDAIITVEESNSSEMSVDYKEGMAFDKGYQSHHFVNRPETGECIIDKPYILITDQRISQMPEFVAFLNNFIEGQKENGQQPNTALVVISNGVDGLPLANFINLKMQGQLQTVCITAPGMATQQKEFLEDIAIVTGGSLVSREVGLRLDQVKPGQLGQATKVVVTKDSTTIIGGQGRVDKVKERVTQMRAQLEHTDFAFDREKLEERIAKLTSGIAIINVGAPSEAEQREKKERCIDAIAATKAAIDGGIVPGGEITLISASADLRTFQEKDDIATGYGIVQKACKAPFKKLMENSGYDAGQMLERIMDQPLGTGIDVMDGNVKDMIKAGIIDPANVVKNALENAASAAAMIITTNTVITVDDDKSDV